MLSWAILFLIVALVAAVFANKATYLDYAEREIGQSAKAMIGYYNIKTMQGKKLQ